MRSPRNIQFAAFSLVMLVIFHDPLYELIAFSSSSHLFFYILLIPFVSIYFLYIRKETIFRINTYSFFSGGLIILAGFIVYFVGQEWRPQFAQNDYLAMMTLSALMAWVGGFVFLYGFQAFRHGLFPLCFFFFMVPIPDLFLDQIIVFLQKGSTEVTDWAFQIIGLPVKRNGFVFSLSKTEIEVAKQCSGIRGSLYLFLTSLVFGQLFLRTPMARVILVFSTLPIALLRNGLRIVITSLLGNYVHEAVLVHHGRGGILTSVLGVIVLVFVIRWLRKAEKYALPQKSSESCDHYLIKGGGSKGWRDQGKT